MKEEIIRLPTFTDERGSLTVVEESMQIPFHSFDAVWFDAPQSFSNCIIIFLSGKGVINRESCQTQITLDKPNKAFHAKEKCKISELSPDALYLVIQEQTEPKVNLPFLIHRLFYIYNIPQGTTRGKHMHQSCDEVLFALKGSFDVKLDDGKEVKNTSINTQSGGLHIPAGIWAEQTNFSKDAICLVLASEKFSEKGYIHSYKEYKRYKQDGD